MIDSIYVAMSGLKGYQEGLRTISNNTANINTPGFKGSTLQFADMFSSNESAVGGGARQLGYGLNSLGTTIDFKQGQLQSTGKDLDMAIDGDGMFTVSTSGGELRYTRDGQFKFNADGFLVSSTTGDKVMVRDGSGGVGALDISGFGTNPASATTRVQFSGNLSSAVSTYTISNITVLDAGGTSYTLSARLDAVTGSPNTWNLTLLNGTTTVGTGTLAFIGGRADPARAQVAVTFTPPGQAPQALTLDFSSNVTSTGTGTSSTLAMATQDGYAAGTLAKATFDAGGVLLLSYSNGQTVRGARLALGRFQSGDALESVGNNEFRLKDGRALLTGVADEQGFGTVRSGMVENSNVDLSQQFSDLVIMQRGYQACSQIVSTANEMLTELFAMRKG